LAKVREIRSKSVPELAEQLGEAKEQLFRLRFQHATHQLDDTSQLRSVRRDIARIQTIITEKVRVGAVDGSGGNGNG
jgi:large subunit ribosomal protein L29